MHAKRGLKSPAAPPPYKIDDNAAREAAIDYAREQERRDRERCRQEAAQEAERSRRRQVTAKAEAALEEARRAHDTKIEEIAAARCALDRQAEAEEDRWNKQRATLLATLNRARE
jgi:hypothetical protein